MQCRSLKELATDGRFPGACGIRSVHASVRESRRSGAKRNWPRGDRTFPPSPPFYIYIYLLRTLVDMPWTSDFSRIKRAELHRNRYCFLPGWSQNANGSRAEFPNISSYRFLLTCRVPLLLTALLSPRRLPALDRRIIGQVEIREPDAALTSRELMVQVGSYNILPAHTYYLNLKSFSTIARSSLMGFPSWRSNPDSQVRDRGSFRFLSMLI